MMIIINLIIIIIIFSRKSKFEFLQDVHIFICYVIVNSSKFFYLVYMCVFLYKIFSLFFLFSNNYKFFFSFFFLYIYIERKKIIFLFSSPSFLYTVYKRSREPILIRYTHLFSYFMCRKLHIKPYIKACLVYIPGFSGYSAIKILRLFPIWFQIFSIITRAKKSCSLFF